MLIYIFCNALCPPEKCERLDMQGNDHSLIGGTVSALLRGTEETHEKSLLRLMSVPFEIQTGHHQNGGPTCLEEKFCCGSTWLTRLESSFPLWSVYKDYCLGVHIFSI
jgi:hypothetical protein